MWQHHSPGPLPATPTGPKGHANPVLRPQVRQAVWLLLVRTAGLSVGEKRCPWVRCCHRLPEAGFGLGGTWLLLLGGGRHVQTASLLPPPHRRLPLQVLGWRSVAWHRDPARRVFPIRRVFSLPLVLEARPALVPCDTLVSYVLTLHLHLPDLTLMLFCRHGVPMFAIMPLANDDGFPFKSCTGTPF